MTDLAAYYAKRAAEYERFYDKPERQAEYAALRARVAELLAGRRVLELACGTGYWTKVMSATARDVTALDFNQEVLDVAAAKNLPQDKVSFGIGDAYALPDLGRRHDALFAGFWWSHVLLQDLDSFLRGAVNAVAPGALITFLDNRYVEGSNTPVSRRDGEGNTYQARKLEKDGSMHEVLKNFPDDAELLRRASVYGAQAKVENFKFFWLLSWRAPA
jgi:demethylmenaquinone methyltransferase/2-methoxy-6-polyprenyl-1,4-benzoquinol methylase